MTNELEAMDLALIEQYPILNEFRKDLTDFLQVRLQYMKTAFDLARAFPQHSIRVETALTFLRRSLRLAIDHHKEVQRLDDV